MTTHQTLICSGPHAHTVYCHCNWRLTCDSWSDAVYAASSHEHTAPNTPYFPQP
jgi:hypothetical protein